MVCCNDVSVEQRNMTEWGYLGLSMNRRFYTPSFLDIGHLQNHLHFSNRTEFEKRNFQKRENISFWCSRPSPPPYHPQPLCQLKQLHQHYQGALVDNLLLLIHSITFMTTQSTISSTNHQGNSNLELGLQTKLK